MLPEPRPRWRMWRERKVRISPPSPNRLSASTKFYLILNYCRKTNAHHIWVLGPQLQKTARRPQPLTCWIDGVWCEGGLEYVDTKGYLIMMVLVSIIVLSTGNVIWISSIPSIPARPKRDICYFYNQGSDLLSNSQQENKTKIYWGCNPVTLANHLGFNLS